MNRSITDGLTLKTPPRWALFPSIYDSPSKPTFPELLWIFIELLLILSYTVKPSPYRPLFFFAILALTVYTLLFTRMRMLEHVANSEWGVSCRLAGNILFASMNILLGDVHKEVKYLPLKHLRKASSKKEKEAREGDQKEERELDIAEEPFWTRFKWAFKLWFTPNGVGFSHQTGLGVIPSPSSQYSTRTSFLLHQSLCLIYNFFLYDIACIICRANPFFFGDPALYPTGYEAVFWRLFGFVFGFLVYLTLHNEYKMISLLFVGFGISDMDEWPDLFGSFKHSWTLRGFWGKTWHQMFRRSVLAHAHFLTRKLKIPPKSQFARFFILFCVFVLTGLLHHVGDAMVMQSWSKSGALHFFILQAVGIAIEDITLKLLNINIEFNNNDSTKTKTTWTMRFIGFSWVLVWLSITLPVWTDPLCQNGTFLKETPHFSVLMGLWKGQWSFEEKGWPLMPKPVIP